MNAMFLNRGTVDGRCRAGSRLRRARLDRAAIAHAAALRRARVQAIEDDIDHACELAALGGRAWLSCQGRESWDERTWDRYLAEAVRQAQTRCSELDALRQEAAQLVRLAQLG